MYRKYLKRALDIVGASLALVLLSPVMLAVGVVVKCKLGSPVLFRQRRPGRLGAPFRMFKFRTMTDARDERGELLPDGERFTGLGNWLRRTSLDELPELLNVVSGDMSLVGPRPLLMRYYAHFTREESSRFSIRPGITGLAQVMGRNDLAWDGRIALDLRYVRECSFLLDSRILALTIWRVLRSHGVQPDPGAVMIDFDEERKRRADARAAVP